MSYGAKGIGMCDEWRYDVVAFNEWADANGYNDTLTIERIDVTKGYTPENCIWIPPHEQAWNKTNTIRLSNGDSLVKKLIDESLPRTNMYSLLKKHTPDEVLEILRHQKVTNSD